MADKASLFSTTETLVDQPALRYDDAAGGSGGVVPPDDCFTILLIHHDGGTKLETSQFSSAGLPAMLARLDGPSSERSGLKKLTAKKRLQVQFPKQTLAQMTTFRRKAMMTLEEVRERRKGKKTTSSHGRRRTMFDMMEDDMVAIQTRRALDITLTMLFQGRDINSPTLYYHASNINSMPAWAVDKDNLSFAAVPAQWATISFLSPDPNEKERRSEVDPTAITSIPSPTITAGDGNSSDNHVNDKDNEKETDEQVFERMFVPDEASEALLKQLLSHLGSRGVMWSKVGRICRPSRANPHPRSRPEYVVLGLFPKPFTMRCQAFRQQSVAWIADTTEPAKSKRAPLILSTDSSGVSLDGDSKVQQKDFLEGWRIRMTNDEPARTGSMWEDASGISAAFLGIAYA